MPLRSTSAIAFPTHIAPWKIRTARRRRHGSRPEPSDLRLPRAIPERTRIRERLTKLWNYERFSPPSKEGPWYIYCKNDGLQNQAVVYKTKAIDAPAEVLLDPNTLSADGTVALGSAHFTDDGRYMAYSLARAAQTGSSGAFATLRPTRTCQTS